MLGCSSGSRLREQGHGRYRAAWPRWCSPEPCARRGPAWTAHYRAATLRAIPPGVHVACERHAHEPGPWACFNQAVTDELLRWGAAVGGRSDWRTGRTITGCVALIAAGSPVPSICGSSGVAGRVFPAALALRFRGYRLLTRSARCPVASHELLQRTADNLRMTQARALRVPPEFLL